MRAMAAGLDRSAGQDWSADRSRLQPPPTESSFRGRIEATDRIQIRAVLSDKRAVVKAIDYTCKPLRAKEKAGATATWTNAGKLPRSAIATDGSRTTGEIAPGASAIVKFDKPGT